MGSKKHKRHKGEKRETGDANGQSSSDKPPALKLILKVGGNLSTPEHSNDSSGPGASTFPAISNFEDEGASMASASMDSHVEKHKKMKKKKKKKEKDKSKDKHDKKHKHRHKEKRKRTHDEAMAGVMPTPVNPTLETPKKPAIEPLPPPPPILKPRPDTLKAPNSPSKGSLSPRSIEARDREQRSCVMRLKLEQSPFTKLLDYLLKQLEKKDPKQFFAWPVTDSFAPGYSNIITNPMDFSTIKQKIDEHAYKYLQEFSDDFKLMCNNAMTYNHQDTIYYKAARKLLHYGIKTLAQDKVIVLRNILPFMDDVHPEQLGFEMPKEDIDTVSSEPAFESKPVVEKPKEPKKPREMPKSKFEAISDDLTPSEVLKEVQNAANAVAQKVAQRRFGQMGFLRQKKDGSTTLNILVPGDGSSPDTNERPVPLGTLIGKLQHGTGQLHGFKEDRRNLAKAVKPLNYGPFGSYAPSYDSTFANLSKEESDLVYQTYGDETSVQYAESILDFAKGCDYALTMADNLLDLMTNGDHRRSKKVLEEKKRLRDEEERIRLLMEPPPASPAPPPLPSHIDFNALRSLTDLGIDIAFLETMEKSVRKKEEIATANEAMQARLDNTSALIQKLEMVQNERLSQEPPPHLSHIPGPSSAELNLAALVTDSLVDISARLPPEAVASLPGVRKALGVAAIVHEPPVPDLESELREFLESQSALAVDDDKTIEEILSEP